MIDHSYFSHEHIRKLIAVFGSLFDDMAMVRRGEEDQALQLIYPVPIEYAPRDKFLARLDKQSEDDGDRSTKYHEIYPRMAFEVTGMNYAPNRNLPKQQRHVKRVGESQLIVHKTPTPYDIAIDLNIASRHAGEVHQLVEQILPYFQPQITVPMVDFPVKGETYDMPLILTGIGWDDEYEGDLDSIRRVTFTLNFVAQYRFYGSAGTDHEVEILKLMNEMRAKEGKPPKNSAAIQPAITNTRVNHYGSTYGYYDEAHATKWVEESANE